MCALVTGVQTCALPISDAGEEVLDFAAHRHALENNPPDHDEHFKSDTYVVLLVDELAKIPAAHVDNVRSKLCNAMTDRPLYVVFSSLSVELMDAEITGSNRGVFRFGLPLLTTSEAQRMIESALRGTHFQIAQDRK